MYKRITRNMKSVPDCNEFDNYSIFRFSDYEYYFHLINNECSNRINLILENDFKSSIKSILFNVKGCSPVYYNNNKLYIVGPDIIIDENTTKDEFFNLMIEFDGIYEDIFTDVKKWVHVLSNEIRKNNL